ncbi:MAG: pyruvate, phosphate dikinase [Planctomycetota bacterium]
MRNPRSSCADGASPAATPAGRRSDRRIARDARPSAPASRQRWVYAFDELPAAERAAGSREGVLRLLGGKGANLAEMTRLGVPVPPGFVISTAACNAYLAGGGRLPTGLWDQVLLALRQLERRSGARFGDPQNPLLLSCRSGARFSMPGMMDTVLDLGLDEATAQGLIARTGEPRFVYDAWRRLVQMYGSVVLGVPDEAFEGPLAAARRRAGVASDAELPAEALERLVREFRQAVQRHSGQPFPDRPLDQLHGAITAVFASWNGKRAVDYRNAAGIAHDLGTAVNIVQMVYGNLGADSATGVATTRNVTTGEPGLEGDFLLNAQGEDVVSGTRATRPIAELQQVLPRPFAQLQRIARQLERHFGDVQDLEFTVERGTLWLLQTRAAKRTAQAAIRIAVDLAKARRITRDEAVRRVAPQQVDFFLHPQIDAADRAAALAAGQLLATGLNVSPGAAIGRIEFDADAAEQRARAGGDAVILVRPETRPDDVHGMLAAAGTVTCRGGRTSHAALVARQFGKPAVVGADQLDVDVEAGVLRAPGGRELRAGDWLSLDGTTGEVFAGRLRTVVPDVQDPHLVTLLGWADSIRTLGVLANADQGDDALRARRFGAEGIGLCRTEHMFFAPERLPVVQALILAGDDDERRARLRQLLPLQRADFAALFAAMDGLPVTIRLLDPPLHEFLPDREQLTGEVAELRTRARLRDGDPGALAAELQAKERLLRSVEALHEENPMLGRRGVRLGIHMPELVRMQVRAIFEAACDEVGKGRKVLPKIMIPLTTLSDELRVERALLEEEAKQVLKERGRRLRYRFGTMIEVPRAALIADRIAEFAEFFSFGTNDLTQTTFGISRDDAATGFLQEYLRQGILRDDPFATIDREGVGELMRICVERGRRARKDLDVGICGEHGGDPRSIALCQELGLDYVSCSAFRVPIARLAAAHAALAQRDAAAAGPASARTRRPRR